MWKVDTAISVTMESMFPVLLLPSKQNQSLMITLQQDSFINSMAGYGRVKDRRS